MIKEIREELDKLDKYRELFKKIISLDLNLEYTGRELKHYYETIENEKWRNDNGI